ncbi:protein tyrosine phosphatase family protein [Massilia endophytica]|uniref:protein tyrosine phosphatase family protein n=1 Tax=Massilia endophytica TaxID=2899220 RepID=UPI001E3A25CA|nr:protein tyrosine phosphatase family protein [Massilia endophytica]UGQ48780.1 protein tyrosine phosphatase family protein [Massilia endophytica]
MSFDTLSKLYFRSAVLVAIVLAVGILAANARADAPSIQAPNVVAISLSIVTSGQPTAEALAQLSEQGFKAVIYLAPPTVGDAIPNEREIVERQGMEFLNIPIPFGQPTDADFEQFAAAMKRFGGGKVLVHCQVNMRASTMTFLYRTVVLREAPEKAYEAVARVWSPKGPWKQLVVSQLRKAKIPFEPY